MSEIVVIGAGVSGLTCSVRLLEEGYSVAILSSEPVAETTSSVAAALWFPFRAYPLEKVVGWSLESLKRFQVMETIGDAGIATRRVSELYRNDPPPPEWRAELEGFRVLGRDEVPPGFRGGYSIRAPVIDSSRYLPWLRERAIGLGATLEIRDVGRLSDLRSEADLVVNCSGVGSRDLAGDPAVIPLRGQVVRVPRGRFDDVTVDEGSAEAAYIVPRTDDCILGTTLEEDRWDRTPTDQSTLEIIRRCAELDPRVMDAEVLEARVGLRPGRHEVRLEAVAVDGLAVVHNYGHGGSGFTLSWGCAEQVVRLVNAWRRHTTPPR